MTALVVTVFLASLLGSLHCAAMCGPLVAVYAGADPSRGWRRGIGHACYSGGRLVAYGILGAAAGSLGAALDLAGSLAGVQRVTAILAGVLIALWGVVSLLQLRGVDVGRLALPASVQRLLGRLMAQLREKPPMVRALVIGLASALLPCGWLYAFVVAAAGTSSALRGALVMAVFWAGTLPVMVSLGFGLQAMAGPLRRHLPTISAVALIVVGLLAVVTRIEKVAVATSGRRAPTTVEQAVEQVQAAAEEEPPCCAGP
ncbi:MAG: sulfite exporter TauE/SafE family protein [Acidobacteriota bacterium]|nr:sulfite exporter TauE/SafE family protein [Acidobacteriota bacterium]MDQ7086675.1 sulfite exporter TauE/SafE family protein [Acidobacteriota bacterium]